MNLDLRSIFSACQSDSADDWLPQLGPAFPGVAVHEVQLDSGEIVAQPLTSRHKAVYTRDARLQLAWGISDGEPNDDQPATDLVPAGLGQIKAKAEVAYLLVNGVPVWAVDTVALNWGAAERATIVQPARTSEGVWTLTDWEVSFGRLLTALGRGLGKKDVHTRLEDVGLVIEFSGSPLDQHGPQYAPLSSH